MTTSTTPELGISPKSAALLKAWATRRANAAAKLVAGTPAPVAETPVVTAPVAPVTPAVTVVASTPAPTPAAAPKANVQPQKADKPARKGLTLCLCGHCDHKVTGDFGQGHDARLKSDLLAVRKGTKKLSDLRADQLAALPRLKFVLSSFQDILGTLPKVVKSAVA